MGRKRIKGTKYNRVTKQQKYIFLKLCITEKQSIHEVLISLTRRPSMQASTIQQPKLSYSSTKNNTKTTPPTWSMIPTSSPSKPTRCKPPGWKSLSMWIRIIRIYLESSSSSTPKRDTWSRGPRGRIAGTPLEKGTLIQKSFRSRSNTKKMTLFVLFRIETIRWRLRLREMIIGIAWGGWVHPKPSNKIIFIDSSFFIIPSYKP